MFENERIEKRLTKSFFVVSLIAAAAAVMGLAAMIIVSCRYAYVLPNYGFAQGDIGRAMFEFADVRSSLRAAIGYEDAEAIEKMVVQHDETKALFDEAFAAVEGTIVSKSGREIYDAIAAELDAYWELDAKIMSIGMSTDQELGRQAQELAMNELAEAYTSIYSKLEELLDVKVREGDANSKTLTVLSWTLGIIVVLVSLSGFFIATRIGRKIAKSIALPLGELGERLTTFAAGDLSTPFPETRSDDEVADMVKEAGAMAESLNIIINDAGEVMEQMANGNYSVKSNAADKYTGDFAKLYTAMRTMRNKMSETLISIGEASGQVNAGAMNLADAAQNLAEGATNQAASVEELHASIVNITSTMEQSAKNSEDSYIQAKRCADEAGRSREIMNTTVEAMERISTSSQKIGNIISEIESIAEQTNLLSLNASIEAARAGESGRGFAVVADQIRQLAEQSAKSVVDTRELIEESMRDIEAGNSTVERVSESIMSVVDGIQKIAENSQEMSIMAQDHVEAMKQAEEGVEQISQVVQSNSATAQETSATSQELSAQATTLDELIAQFTLKQ